MKIVHIDHYFDNGFGYQINLLPDYQSQLGHDVTLITSNSFNQKNTNENVSVLGKFNYKGFMVHRIPIWGEFKGRFVLFKGLIRYLEEENPDYIFCHAGATSLYIKDVTIYKRRHPDVFVAVDNHADLNISGRNKIWRKLYYNTFWKNYIKAYDKFVNIYFGVTPARCLFLNEELGINSSKTRLLPIGCDVLNGVQFTSREEFRSKLDIAPNDILLIHGGKLTEEKENWKIIEAFSRIKMDNIKLILFGSINDKRIEERILKDNRIIFLGWQTRESTLNLLKHSDLGVWNTQHTTLIEDAISVELPLMLRYYGSTSHLIKNSGVFLYEGSIREIQDRLQFLFTHPDALNSLKKNTRVIKEILSYGNIAKESINYMKDLKPQMTHQLFMSLDYTDFNYENIRKISD